MVDILHRVGVEGRTADCVFTALTTRDGLAGWWTEKVTGESEIGGSLAFRFDVDGVEIGGFDMRVVELVPAKRVRWEVIDGPPEWIGTTVTFDLSEQDGYGIILFAHEGWREPVEFMHHCSTKWATFLLSLKALLETGTGSPAPNDVKVSDWH